jgi:hypothetical protein
MTLFAESQARIAAPGERLMQSPRIVLPEAPDWRSSRSFGAPAAFSSMTGAKGGAFTQPFWVVPSMTTGLVMAGRFPVSTIVLAPGGFMPNRIVSRPAAAFASSMAARSVHLFPAVLQFPSMPASGASPASFTVKVAA